MAKRKTSIPTNGDVLESDEEMYAVIDEQTTTETVTKQSEPVVRLCECGCGQPVAGKKAKFRPGHDAVYKGQLLLAARAGNAEARATLIERGWATDESIDRVAAKGQQSAEQKQARQRERLTAKLNQAKAEVSRLEAELAELG